MKRYISISLSLLTLSLLNVVTWLCMGFTMGNPDLSSVFSLTYPIWFIVAVLLSVFGTGANVRKNKKKDKTDNFVYSGMIYGLIFGAIVFGILTVFSDNYVSFMHMDVAVYRNFARFTILQAFAWLIFQLVLEKLYFEDKDRQANIHAVLFYLLSFVGLIICSLITKNEKIITFVTLGLIYIYAIALLFTHFKKFKFEWNFLPNIRYDSITLFSNLFYFVTYFVGYSNAFEAGEKYVVALNLVNLITDPQWDALEAVSKVAKIDLSKSNYNFKSAIRRSAALTMMYVASSVILFFSLFSVYGISITIGLIFLAIQISDMLVDIFLPNLQCFLHLEFSAVFSTVVNLVVKALRAVLSVVLLTPFNTNIAQISFDVLALIVFSAVTATFFRLEKSGKLVARKKKIKVDNIVLFVDRKIQKN